jgi:hypothetical protein
MSVLPDGNVRRLADEFGVPERLTASPATDEWCAAVGPLRRSNALGIAAGEPGCGTSQSGLHRVE